jgi:hypothetical protein
MSLHSLNVYVINIRSKYIITVSWVLLREVGLEQGCEHLKVLFLDLGPWQ